MEQTDFNEMAKKALEFTKRYYKTLDDLSDRPNLIHFYPNFSNLCEWNGHQYSTKEDVARYLSEMPKTKHQIDVLDSHPLPGNNSKSSNSEEADHTFLVTVHGVVTYDDEHKREFFQRFVIRQKGITYYIVNDYYRWLSEKM